MTKKVFLAPFLIFFTLIHFAVYAQEEETPEFQAREPGELMTVDRIESIVRVLSPDAVREGNAILFSYPVQDAGILSINIITDPNADRMRIIIGIVRDESITPDRMKRILQANFDSALDARYAIAQGILWSTFIHPLGSLTDDDFLSGLGQTINLVLTYGSTYSSGALVFGGGDSQGILEDLLEEFRKKTEPEI